MAGVAQNPRGDFWQRPADDSLSAPSESAAALSHACSQCGAEFLAGAGFCHGCGSPRHFPAAASQADNSRPLSATISYAIQKLLGLSGIALAAFFVGIGCILAALLVGVVHPVYDAIDFQVVHFWRMQWLVAAIAAFAAGILLKRPEAERK